MAALTLSRAEYLVILDILHANYIFGLDNRSLFPANRETHLDLIQQGIRQLERRQLVRIEGGRHIIERRLLELGAVVARPQVAIMTIRDRIGIGQQLYTHYQVGDQVVEQVLPDENHYQLGQLPDIASALDRIVRLLDLPDGACAFPQPHAIERDLLYDVQARIEAGSRIEAVDALALSGWPVTFADAFSSALANRLFTGFINLAAIVGSQPEERRDLTFFRDDEYAWLVTSHPHEHHRLFVRQINAAAFRSALNMAYAAVAQQAQEHPHDRH